MNTGKALRFAGYFFVLSGIALIVYLRILGIDMTEGRLLITFAPYWVLSIGLLVSGFSIVRNTE